MILLEDTRQQAYCHNNVHYWAKEKGITIERCRLYVGDYIIANKGDISVDTKKDVNELAMDLLQDHVRFRDEIERAKAADIKLIILVEEVLPPGGIVNWVPPKGRKVNPVQLRKMMITMQERYGVMFRFCANHESPQVMWEYLKGVRR